MNKWKSIWNDRKGGEALQDGSTEEVFMSLKSLMGISSSNDIAFDSYKNQFEACLNKMERYFPSVELNSFFEVGCGSGMYLYYLARRKDGMRLGGLDYSEPLLESAKTVLLAPSFSAEVDELYCGEANDIDTDKKYDCVYSRSVFQYFPSEAFGLDVAEKMLNKSDHCVGIFDLFDSSKREDFLSYRRSKIENYDEKYADTPHQFYPKEMFLKLAEKYNCDVLFTRDPLPGYWNELFSYDVYFYKRHVEEDIK